jgi:hypothetical protein
MVGVLVGIRCFHNLKGLQDSWHVIVRLTPIGCGILQKWGDMGRRVTVCSPTGIAKVCL